LRILKSQKGRLKLHVETSYTGELISRDSFKPGYIKGTRKIYTRAATSCNCSFAFAKVYTRKKAATSVDLLRKRVIPFYSSYEIKPDRILTDN